MKKFNRFAVFFVLLIIISAGALAVRPEKATCSPVYAFDSKPHIEPIYEINEEAGSVTEKSDFFTVGETRLFYLIKPYLLPSSSPNYATLPDTIEITANLLGQGAHTNIWVLDDEDFHTKTGTVCAGATCALQSLDIQIADDLATAFDTTYEAMTDPVTGFGPHAYVSVYSLVESGMVGDNDGKINFLMYDVNSAGGFFSIGDLMSKTAKSNALDMVHVDCLGIDTPTVFDRAIGVMAHEFQHYLFYMHYGNFTPHFTSGYESDLWINESLAQFAVVFYSFPGSDITDIYWYTTINQYFGADFVHFANMKNYGMGELFSRMHHQKYESFASKIYQYMQTRWPRAGNSSELLANTNSFSPTRPMQNAVGDFLHAATGIGPGGEKSLEMIYFDFMENFGSDGGMVYGDSPVQSLKHIATSRPIDSLWAWRSVNGLAQGRIYTDTLGSGSMTYPFTEAFPQLASGGQVLLETPGLGSAATYEKFYVIGGSSAAPVLTITAPDDGNERTRYYVVIPNDPLIVSTYTYSSGLLGADVYPLEKGVQTTFNTNLPANQQAYLMVVTYYQDVNTTVQYSWAAVTATVTDVSVSPGNASVNKGNSQSFSASVTGTNNPPESVYWMVIGNKSAQTFITTAGVLHVANDETAATLTVKAISAYDTSQFDSVTVSVTSMAYDISLSQSGTYNFSSLNPLTVTAANAGTNPTGVLTINITGSYAASYEILNDDVSAGIAVGDQKTFTVAPISGLAAVTHTATVTVSGGNGISKSFNVSLIITQEVTPNAGIDYSAETLTGLVSGIYSVNGGASVTVTTTQPSISTYIGTAATSISIVKVGNGSTNLDSAPHTLAIPARGAAPLIGKTDCTTSSNNDGTITGVTTAMEYSPDGGTSWTNCTDTTVTGLSNGTYQVRVKAVTGTSFASAVSTVTINESGVAITYTITWKNWDGEVLGIENYEYNEIPVWKGSEPAKPSSTTQHFSFGNWIPAIAAVTGAAEYTAVFEPSTRYYIVTFKNWDGEVLKTENVEYGGSATAPANPARPATAQYTYTFSGWNATFGNITADLEIAAQYTETKVEPKNKDLWTSIVSWIDENSDLVIYTGIGAGTVLILTVSAVIIRKRKNGT